MVRLMLVLAPVMCILSGIGISAMLTRYCSELEPASSSTASNGTSQKSHTQEKKQKRQEGHASFRNEVCLMYNLYIH